MSTRRIRIYREHMSRVVDTLLIVRDLELIEKELPVVIFPQFYYGASSFAV